MEDVLLRQHKFTLGAFCFTFSGQLQHNYRACLCRFFYFSTFMPTQKAIWIGLAALIVLFGLYCYNPFLLWFQNDDFIHIPLSANVELLQRNTFRPVCDLSIMLDYWLWGKNAFGYHISNIALHIIATVLLYYFTRLILQKYFKKIGPEVISLFASLLFFVYAMHGESVFWILGRSSVLAMIFSLCFLFCYIKRNDSRKYIIAYILFLILCLLTYESVWMLPLYCLIITLIDQKMHATNRAFRHLLLVFLIFAVYLAVRYFSIHEVVGKYEAAALLKGEIKKIITNYAILFARSLFPYFSNDIWLLYGFGLSNLCMLFFIFRLPGRSLAGLFLLGLVFLVSLTPYTSLGVDTHGTEAERFLYFPSVVYCIITALIIQMAVVNKKIRIVAALFLVAMHCIALESSSENYRFAGKVNQSVIDELNKTKNIHTVYAADLPQSQHGALMLRTGFPEMVGWLSNSTIDTMVICSRRNDLATLKENYRVLYAQDSFPPCKRSYINAAQNDSMKLHSIIFRFTDSALLVTKP